VADEQDVLHAWQGLGYYSRARNLLKGARQVVRQHGGRVPSDVPGLLALPGVGRYTAGAIASIAYNVPAPIVDGNVIRVLTRLHGLYGDPSRAPLKDVLWDLAAGLIPEGRAGDFNQAMMELGATVCTPANPSCATCPVSAACLANAEGLQQVLPETAARPAPTSVQVAAALLRDGERLLLVQLPAEAPRWAGMWQFPNVEVAAGEGHLGALQQVVRDMVGLKVLQAEPAVRVRHSVTRFRITLDAYRCGYEGAPSANGSVWRWVTLGELDNLALPKAHRTIANRLAGRSEDEGQRTLDLGD
jgi:A/G-specific adenine glycosylase